MKKLEITSQVSDFWTHFDEVRGRGAHNRPCESVIAPYAAAVLLLRWAEHMEAEQEALAAFDGNDYVPAVPRAQHWSSWCALGGGKIVDVLRKEVLPALRRRPQGSVGQALQRVVYVVENLTSESPETIKALVQWCQAFDFETGSGKQVAGEALEALIEKTAEQPSGIGAPLAIPKPVVELMVDLLDPRPGQRICDPSFGTGEVLATVANRLREQAMRMPATVWTQVQQQSLFGAEIDPYRYCIGLARVVLAGIEQPGLELGSDLGRPLAKDLSSEGFDCIVTVVPSNGHIHSAFSEQYPVPSAKLETLFLQQVMASLRTGGRAVVALPEGVLFRTGPDRRVRKMLLSDYYVEGVISLPPDAFHPYTGLKMSLVLFRRQKAKKTVRFMQVEKWPSIRPEDEFSHEKAVTVAHNIAEQFRNGAPNGDLWETPIKELATRDWELIVKRTGEEALSRFLQALKEADTEIPVQSLDEVAEVFAGVSYDKSVTTPHGDDPSVFAGLVRVADVNPAGARSPSLFLTREGSKRVRSKHKLRAGDVLLTTSGTIGKLAVVSKSAGTESAVAARSLIVIRPKERISSEFLKSVLASDTYQQWIRGHARGATIQHLSIRTLRNLLVPLPQVTVQVLVALQMVGENTDPLAAMMRILAGASEDPVAAWLEGSFEVHELRQPYQASDPFVLLDRIARSVVRLRNQVAHSQIDTTPHLARWLLEFAEALRTLQDIHSVPRGAGRMAILDSALLRLEHVQATIGESSLPALDSAKDVTRRISRLIRAELDSIMEDVRFEPDVEPSAVVAGTENEIQVRVKNLSPLALRNVSVSTTPSVGSTHVGYLAEGEALSFTAKIPARVETGTFPFKLQWRADRLDGHPVSGELPLAVDVRSTREAVHLADLGKSPYIVGNPIDIDREEMFFGRQDIIDKIQRQLSTSHQANVTLLEGNRRTGKTSILKRLQAPDMLPDWIVVNCSFQGGEGHESKAGLPTNEVFRLMARDIGWTTYDAGLRVWLPDMDPPDPGKRFKVAFLKALSTAFSGPRPFEAFELYIQAVLEAASPRRLLLMLDEFDKLQEGIDSGVTSPQVPENIRYLLHTYPGLSAILTGSRRLKRLREEYWSALFGLGHRVPVSELPLEDARLLVTRPVEGRLSYVPDARDRVVELCSRHPFLIQSLCNRIFECAVLSNERTVTVGAVNTSAQEMVKDNEHFRTLWGYALTERRRFLLTLCQQLEGEPDPITLSLLETKLEECGVALPSGDRLGEDLEFLRELELLELQGSAYTLAVPLMADWIRHNIDFEDQRQQAVRESEEMDVADGYGYGEGDGSGSPDGSGYGAGHGHGYGSLTTEDE